MTAAHSAAARGKWADPGYREKITAAMRGRVLSSETRARISAVKQKHSIPMITAARVLWNMGASAREIGGQLGMTRDAVIGLAHRNGFPPHPSPLRRAA